MFTKRNVLYKIVGIVNIFECTKKFKKRKEIQLRNIYVIF